MPALMEHFALWSGLLSTDTDAEIAVLGIPFDNAVSWRDGTQHAPERIRSLTPHLGFVTEEGNILTMRVRDYGDIEPDLNWERFFGTVQSTAFDIINGAHQLPIFIGGDHSVGIPLFKAFASSQDCSVGYIQFDSHADLADNFGGHPWSHANTARRNLEQPNLSVDHLAFVGLRSYLTEEIEFYKANPSIGWHTARSVYKRSIETIAHEIVAQMQGLEAIYLSIDIDGLDPASAPGTGTPEHGGPSTRECLELIRILFEHLPIKAMDIVEVSPPLDIADVTSLAAAKIMYETFGFVQQKK